MSQRIVTTCSKKFGHLFNDPIALADLIDASKNDSKFISEICREASLEIVNQVSALEFCREKVSNYFDELKIK